MRSHLGVDGALRRDVRRAEGDARSSCAPATSYSQRALRPSPIARARRSFRSHRRSTSTAAHRQAAPRRSRRASSSELLGGVQLRTRATGPNQVFIVGGSSSSRSRVQFAAAWTPVAASTLRRRTNTSPNSMRAEHRADERDLPRVQPLSTWYTREQQRDDDLRRPESDRRDQPLERVAAEHQLLHAVGDDEIQQRRRGEVRMNAGLCCQANGSTTVQHHRDDADQQRTAEQSEPSRSASRPPASARGRAPTASACPTRGRAASARARPRAAPTGWNTA